MKDNYPMFWNFTPVFATGICLNIFNQKMSIYPAIQNYFDLLHTLIYIPAAQHSS